MKYYISQLKRILFRYSFKSESFNKLRIHQMFSRISNSESTNLLWFLFQLANCEKILFRMNKKCVEKILWKKWWWKLVWKHLMNSLEYIYLIRDINPPNNQFFVFPNFFHEFFSIWAIDKDNKLLSYPAYLEAQISCIFAEIVNLRLIY